MARLIWCVFLVVFLVMLVFGWYLIYQQNAECERRGGILVKGVMSYQCVAMEGK